MKPQVPGRQPASPDANIPFNRPYVAGRDVEYATIAMRSTVLHGDGPFTHRATQALLRLMGVDHGLLTTSCTHALELACVLLGIGDGDEVVVPSFTFSSTAAAVAMRGGTPVFVDVRPDTLNLDETALEAAITPRTKAVFVVHYGGVGAEMDAILTVAARYGIAVVEDNAHGLGGTWRGKPLGTFGRLATQSFHDTKNLHCGEGGALLINDGSLRERAEIVREKGTDRSRFLRGEVDKYTWVDLGSSYLPSDVLAAFLLGQLESFEEIQTLRNRIWRSYADGLREWAGRFGIQLMQVPPHVQHAAHLFYLVLPTAQDRQDFIDHMRAHDILVVFHYLPLDLSPAGQRFGRASVPCVVTQDLSARLVRLPLFPDMTERDVERVVESVSAFRPSASRLSTSSGRSISLPQLAQASAAGLEKS